jgi:hypothetical protein
MKNNANIAKAKVVLIFEELKSTDPSVIACTYSYDHLPVCTLCSIMFKLKANFCISVDCAKVFSGMFLFCFLFLFLFLNSEREKNCKNLRNRKNGRKMYILTVGQFIFF